MAGDMTVAELFGLLREHPGFEVRLRVEEGTTGFDRIDVCGPRGEGGRYPQASFVVSPARAGGSVADEHGYGCREAIDRVAAAAAVPRTVSRREIERRADELVRPLGVLAGSRDAEMLRRREVARVTLRLIEELPEGVVVV